MIIFHHNDLDGRAAAAVVYWNNLYRATKQNVRMLVEIDYRYDFPVELIQKGEKTWIVDFALQDQRGWKRLGEVTSDVTWIDHHKSSWRWIEPAQDYVAGINTTINEAACAALLTWQHLHYKLGPIPFALGYIDAWDRWKHEDNEDVLDFVAGMKSVETKPDDLMWRQLLYDNLWSQMDIMEDVLKRGMSVRCYESNYHKEIMKAGYRLEWKGEECFAVNAPVHNSKAFGDIMQDVDIVISWIWDGEQYDVHMYSEKVDVGALAEAHGGGGHKGAAGFQAKKLPWK